MGESTTTYTFDKLIAPFSREQFFSEYWEKKHLLLRREDTGYYQELLSLKILDRGYAIVERDGRIVKAPEDAPAPSELRVRVARGEFKARVID